MNPEHAITTLTTILQRVDQYRAEIERAANEADAQWRGLGRVGAQRADHAAAIMSATVAPAVADLESFCARVRAQFDGMAAEPFRS